MTSRLSGADHGVGLRSQRRLHRPVVGFALVAAVGGVLLAGLTGIPRETDALPEIARHALVTAVASWGQVEVVSSIVYGTRGFDTFGETFLLLAAVVSVVTLSRTRERRTEYVGEAAAGRTERAEVSPGDSEDAEEKQAREAEEREEAESSEPPPRDADSVPLGAVGPERAEAMTTVVRVAARVAAVPLAVASVYLAAWGYTPGGGFPGGAAVAGVALLLYTALGRRAIRAAVREAVVEPIELAGAALLIALGIAGLVTKGSMFANFLPLATPATIIAGGSQQLYSGFELIEVATGITIAIFSLLGMEHDWASDEESDEESDAGSDDSDSDDSDSGAAENGGERS